MGIDVPVGGMPGGPWSWVCRQAGKREQRYYNVFVQKDLWGEWSLVKSWGRIGSKLGQMRIEPIESDGLGRSLGQIHKTRLQHGYVLVRGDI